MARKNTHVDFGDMFAEVTSSADVAYGKTPVLFVDLSGNSYMEIDLTARKRKAYANKLRKLADMIEEVQ
jgi:hypothetical protein